MTRWAPSRSPSGRPPAGGGEQATLGREGRASKDDLCDVYGPDSEETWEIADVLTRLRLTGRG